MKEANANLIEKLSNDILFFIKLLFDETFFYQFSIGIELESSMNFLVIEE